MTGGIIRIVLGVVIIVLGFTGLLSVFGEKSGIATAVIGGVFIALGIYRIVQARGSS